MADQSHYRITAKLNGVEVPVIRLHLQEALSEPFMAHLDVYDTGFNHKPLNIEQKLEAYAVITLWDGDKPVRYVNGIVHAIEAGAVGTRRRYFTLTIVPELYALKLTHDCRIFQNLDVEGIIRLLLREHRVLFLDFALKKRRENRAYCVQFEESVFDFIHRLLAEEGIWYYFEHTADYHKLMFRDGVERAEAIGPLGYQDRSANKTAPCIWEVGYAEQRVPTRTTQRDRTFKNPNYTLEHTYHGLYIENQRKDAYKTYRYHGRYKRDEQGKPFTQYFQQQLQNRQRVATFRHDYLHVKEGQRFRLQNHPEDTRNQLWVTVRNTLAVEQPQASHEEAQANFNSGVPIPVQYASHFELETEAIPYPQQFSPPAWPKPVVHGVHIADVVGPPNEEIFCDDYGRVAVQFPWDRYAKGDHTSSCWIRVAQNWAGAAWGHIAIPRIGHEVLVSYDNGDIDQPIITGRSYNANNLPPYKLAQHKTKMVIKSKTHRGKGYNELSFEDESNRQQIFMHGEKDQDIIIKNDRREHIRHDRHLKVDNDRIEEVGQDSSSKVDRDRSEGTGRKYSVTVGEEQTIQIGKHYHLKTGKTQYFHSGKHIVLESGEELTIQSSGGFIKIDGGGITIQGKVVNINSGGSPGIGHPVQANIARAATLATGGSTREAKASEAPQPEPLAVASPPPAGMNPESSQTPIVQRMQQASKVHAPVVANSEEKEEDTRLITILIKLPRSDAEGMEGKGLGGHTGIAIGEEFYDFGPSGSAWESDGIPWWDKYLMDADPYDSLRKLEDVDLQHILSYIKTDVKQDVYKVEIEVTPNQAKEAEKWWLDRYKNLGTYSVKPWTGEQCTTTVRISLEKAGVITSSTTQTPEGLLDYLKKNATHTAGENKEKPAIVTKIQNEQ